MGHTHMEYAMTPEYKEIMRHVNRAKSQVSKGNAIKAMQAVSVCLTELMQTQGRLVGRERMEVDMILGEVLRNLAEHPEMSHLFPKGLNYQKGKERLLLAQINAVQNSLSRAIEQAELSKMRGRANSIDKAMMAAQKLLDANDPMEARKVFRRIQQDFGDEPGIFQDMGARLLRAGLAAESIEYFEEAIKQDARDSRPYTHMVMAYESIGELDKAEDMLKETLRNFGNNERVYLRMANISVQKRKYDAAYDAATMALELNPFSREAKKIIKQVEPRVFGNRARSGDAPSVQL